MLYRFTKNDNRLSVITEGICSLLPTIMTDLNQKSSSCRFIGDFDVAVVKKGSARELQFHPFKGPAADEDEHKVKANDDGNVGIERQGRSVQYNVPQGIYCIGGGIKTREES